MYCEARRLGSTARAEKTKQTKKMAASAAAMNRGDLMGRSRQILELLNNDFIFPLQRTLVTGDHVKHQQDFFLTRCGHTGSEKVFGDDRTHAVQGRSTDRFEAGATAFPVKKIGHGAGGRLKGRDISRNVEGLNGELRVAFVGGITPPAQFDVHLAIMFCAAPIVEGGHAEHDWGIQMRRIAHHEDVGAVTEAVRESEMRAGPAGVLFPNFQMQSAVSVGPGVFGIEEIVYAADIGRDGADLPIVSAEAKWNGGGDLRGTRALHDLRGGDGAGRRGGEIHSRCWMIAGVNQ